MRRESMCICVRPGSVPICFISPLLYPRPLVSVLILVRVVLPFHPHRVTKRENGLARCVVLAERRTIIPRDVEGGPGIAHRVLRSALSPGNERTAGPRPAASAPSSLVGRVVCSFGPVYRGFRSRDSFGSDSRRASRQTYICQSLPLQAALLQGAMRARACSSLRWSGATEYIPGYVFR